MSLSEDNTIKNKMVYNKITMSFPKEMEVLFRKRYFSDSLMQFRIAFLLVTLLYASFGYLDILIVPENAKTFHIIRYFIVVPLLSIVLVLSFTKIFRHIWQVLMLVSEIVGGAGISYMIILVPENYAYYAGMMLIFMAGYFFIKLRFFMASIAGWTTLLIYNLGALLYADASFLILISNNFIFVSANLIGMFAGYNIEYYARRNYYMNQLLDIQKDALDATNKHLEKTVEERTKELVEARNEAIKSDHLKSALIAEDDETSEMLTSAILEKFGALLIKVKTGTAAVEACRNDPEIDLVLMDVQMPEMNGYTAARIIRGFNRRIIIIAQTAYGLSGDREKAIESGCNDYISKPVSKDGLPALLKKNLSLS